jgi:hypothetical protein
MKPRPKRKHRRTAKGGIPQENPFIKLLQETNVDQILPSQRKIVVLDDTNTVHEALKVRRRPQKKKLFFFFFFSFLTRNLPYITRQRAEFTTNVSHMKFIV